MKRKLSVRKDDVLHSAYRSERFILKPILRSDRTPAEARYTDAVCRGRVIIENAFGSLKRQFLSLHTELRHAPTRASKIIVSACCLRNYCIETREQPFTANEAIPQQYPEAGDDETDVPDAGEAQSKMTAILQKKNARLSS
ncbi:unnamed protein product [Cylicocyclus nassatus]|uniref:DDE Tnp4 domain-containing protein n=1 Tax=Cylicocyclus nassatus TaxID=53992 RepID=A0AA36H9H3_CYLNA|nr:unnamed protein product [Cylicocyclus nassatus]